MVKLVSRMVEWLKFCVRTIVSVMVFMNFISAIFELFNYI